MTIFLTVLHVMVSVVLIVVVLLQHGKGADIGAVFGGGASSTVFGSRGAGNFLTRMTTAAAIIFMLTSLTLAYVAQDRTGDTLFEGEEAPAAGDATFGEPPPAAGDAPGAFEEVPAPAPEAAPEAAPAEPAPPPEPGSATP